MTTQSTTFPTLFLRHGSPTLGLEDNATTRFFPAWPGQFPMPRAVIVVSAHWDTGQSIAVTAWEQMPIIHDFQGFPAALYRLEYPAPGSLDLAQRVAEILREGGYPPLALEYSRGLDHGTWGPLRLMYPTAELPVLQLSLPVKWGAQRLYGLGRALARLCEDGVMLLGSGGAVHNLSAVDWRADGKVTGWAAVFEDWLRANLLAWNTEDLFNYWRMAPHGVQAHPTEEHLLPLFVAMGAGHTARKPTMVHEGFMYGSLSMLAVQFD